MLKKFLAFLGLASITMVDDRATIEMTAEQMEASGQIIQDRDDAIAEVARLTEELTALKSTHAETERLLSGANTQLESANAEVTRLTEELKVLGETAADTTAAIKTDSNAVDKDKNPCVSSASSAFLDNVKAISEAYL